MKFFKTFFIILTIFTISSCKSKTETKSFKYTQYASGGIPSELDANILLEYKNSTFTKYQIAYISCSCRGAENNYQSVMYIELLNSKPTKDESAIRQISFDKLQNANVGLWGDSTPIHNKPDYTFEYLDKNFIQKLAGKTKKDFDNWGGYGKQIEGIDADAVSGATVSTSNITSVIKSLFKYHTEKYY